MRRREFITLLGGTGRSVAARGARTAAGDAGDRISPYPITRVVRSKLLRSTLSRTAASP
jgi:hypothetical protein